MADQLTAEYFAVKVLLSLDDFSPIWLRRFKLALNYF
jgi:hypothetical protein